MAQRDTNRSKPDTWKKMGEILYEEAIFIFLCPSYIFFWYAYLGMTVVQQIGDIYSENVINASLKTILPSCTLCNKKREA